MSQLTPSDWARLQGFWLALLRFGIYRDGVQLIGCRETPIQVAMADYFEECAGRHLEGDDWKVIRGLAPIPGAD